MRAYTRLISSLFIIMTIVVTMLSIYFKHYANEPLSLNNKEIQLVVEPGMHFKQITQRLVERGLLTETLPWEMFGRLSGASNSIKAGEYTLRANLSPVQLLNKLIKGDTIQFTLTVIEGWTFKQLWEEVQKHEKIKKTTSSLEELLDNLEFSQYPEGWFYPDTY
ncbi:MAG: endolytic transglycosylase MltG, partial [Gammaproteobacteria bacterium]|nr:endolytic transglycosylase MltG [Gammaproteobacteria bacterium]